MYIVGVLVKLALVIVLFVCVVKFMPLYNDDFSVNKTLDSMKDRHGIEDASVEDVRYWLNQGFQVNDLPELIGDSVNVRRKGNEITIDVNYERRVPMIYNIDAVLTFRNSRKIGQ